MLRKKAHTKQPKKTEQEFLRERFKPLNKKFGKQPKKEKVDEDDEEENRKSNVQLLSTVSDDCEQVTEMKDFKATVNKDGYSSNLQHLATNASSLDESGENTSRLDKGKENLPPLYVDI